MSRFKITRPFTIDVGDQDNSPEWYMLRDKPITALQGCSFGFAEEIIGLIEYSDGTFLVGVGESMRPFILLYEGRDAEQASQIFFLEILDRAAEFVGHNRDMKSMTYEALRALEDQLQAKEIIQKVISKLGIDSAHGGFGNSSHVPDRAWGTDIRMLEQSQAFAWTKETTQAVLAASESVPLDTQFNSFNMGTEAVWWHFEEHIPWRTVQDYSRHVRAICMAPVSTHAVIIPEGSPQDDLDAILGGDLEVVAKYKQKYLYGLSIWIDAPPRYPNMIWPSQTLQWKSGESIQEMLTFAEFAHKKVYGPGGKYEKASTIPIEVFLETAEKCAKFILAAHSWLQSKILTADVQHLERHARKRAEKSLKRKAEIRLVQLRKSEHTRSEEPTDEERKRNYSCRFLVEGHWRNQKVGVGRQETKLTWVQPYVKGPDDKPFVVGPKKVFVVNR